MNSLSCAARPVCRSTSKPFSRWRKGSGSGPVTQPAIGVLGSGVGGLPRVEMIERSLPGESVVYFRDAVQNVDQPRTLAEVRRSTIDGLDVLQRQGVKVLVIESEVASIAALRDARERYDLPIVEPIAPTARRAVSLTRTGRVGLLGLSETIRSRTYDELLAVRPEITLVSQECERLVDLIETGNAGPEEARGILREPLGALIDRDIDTLILGCRHYAYLAGTIQHMVGPSVSLAGTGAEGIDQIHTVLQGESLRRGSELGLE